MLNLRFPRLARNRITALGVLLALIFVLAILLLMFASAIQKETSPYFGIFLYLVLPAGLVFGLLLIPLGMALQWRRWRRGETPVEVTWPIVDLNRTSHRNAAAVFVLGTVVFLLLSAFGTYQAYHFSESVQFCGETCHSVMHPQYTAYLGSPHARVPCVECHVGQGASWYAKSKLSGAYQVYAVLANVYPRPITTPIKNLRPARETCEECHWPEITYGAQQRVFNHYRYDRQNSLWTLNMLVKTGGGDPQLHKISGIHWHINPNVEIKYIARDKQRQDIPWVQFHDKVTDRVVLYENTDSPLTKEELDTLEVRTMDCLDCHNQPSHIFNAPDYAIDLAMRAGHIDPTIPDIKSVAVAAMAKEYDSTSVALQGIADFITSHYQSDESGLYDSIATELQNAVLAVQRAYTHNVFPEMKTRWSEYPNNIGHFFSAGCMRCHDGTHMSSDSLTITHDCKACHNILAQGPEGAVEMATTADGLDFKHPEDIDEAWKEMSCTECHDGTQP